MLLGKPAIEKYIASGDIIVDPYDPENLGSSQYDVTLGAHFYREVSHAREIYNPFDERHVRRKWELHEAVKHADIILDHGIVPLENIGRDEKIILVQPGETILAHTLEYIGGACNFITTMMKARSSLGRNFFEVCKCAGMGDVGYFNRWTMEITNNSQHHTIPLVVGRRIAQLLFFKVDPVEGKDKYERAGKYQDSASLEQLKARWTPGADAPQAVERPRSASVARASLTNAEALA
jgi:dCTP deaminase